MEIDNIVLAIDADVDKGLKEVFIGELTPIASNSNKYKWTKKVSSISGSGRRSFKQRKLFKFPTCLGSRNMLL